MPILREGNRVVPPFGADWVWPVEGGCGGDPKAKPVISDGFKAHATESQRQHLGVDIMFKSRVALEPNIPHNTKWFICPRGTRAIACGPGHIWKVYSGAKGWQVIVDHHDVPGFGPCSTFYSHLETVNPKLEKGFAVDAGDFLGAVGDSPASPRDPRHLHFSIRSGDVPVDPAPFLVGFSYRFKGGGKGAPDGAIDIPHGDNHDAVAGIVGADVGLDGKIG